MSAVFSICALCAPITVVHKIIVVPLVGILLPHWLVHRSHQLEIGKMINHCTKAIVFGLAVVGGSVALPVTPAFAQSGSRICGYVATTSTTTIGLLYEIRINDNDSGKQCSDAQAAFWTTIQKDAQLNKLSWTKWTKAACEDIGAKFQSSTVHSDICDPMDWKAFYKVTKTASTNVTIFEKL